MKKFMIMAAIALTASFTSCNKDDGDDGGDTVENCKTCEISAIVATSTKYCDNGDGTITVTVLGISETQDLQGVTFDQFITGLETAGGVCE